MNAQEFGMRMALKGLSKLPPSLLVKMAGGSPISIDGYTVDPMVQLMWAQGKKQPPIRNLELHEGREIFEATARMFASAPEPMLSINDITLELEGRTLPARLYEPGGLGSRAPLTVFFHQGGCVIGSPMVTNSFCTQIAHYAKTKVLSVKYRLAPEHKFPAATDDGVDSFLWAVQHADELDVDPARIAVAGDSAGGLISAVITHETKRRGGPRPRAQLLVFPWLQSYMETPSYKTMADAFPLDSPTMHWFAKQYLHDASELEDVRVSPLKEPDFTGLPPAIVVTAAFDPLRDEGALYADKLRQAQVSVTHKVYTTLPHSFTILGGVVPAAHAASVECAQWFRDALYD